MADDGVPVNLPRFHQLDGGLGIHRVPAVGSDDLDFFSDEGGEFKLADPAIVRIS